MMRYPIFLLLIACFLNACGEGKHAQTHTTGKEDFNAFWRKFRSDETFQWSRIKFPIKRDTYNTDTGAFEKDLIERKEWEYWEVDEKKFIMKLNKENPEKYALNFQINDTGVYVDYVFELIDGNWFLTAIVDGST